MSATNIILQTCVPEDFLTIANLEADAFQGEDFGRVAFGPPNFKAEEKAAYRAGKLRNMTSKPGEAFKMRKAVMTQPDGKQEIVGFALWTTVTGREGRGEQNGKAEKEKEKEKQTDEERWGPGANVRFCEDAFLPSDEIMDKSTKGKDFTKLNILVVSPQCQRRGVGTLLLEEGLKEADAAGLTAVLGASPFGIGLYRKYGFKEFEVRKFNLWEYEGGEGLGVAEHVVMNRPAMVPLQSVAA